MAARPNGAGRGSRDRMKEEHSPKVVSLLEWLVARAQQRGEPVEPIVRRLVLAVLDGVEAEVDQQN